MTEYRNPMPERSPFQFYPNERLMLIDPSTPNTIRLSEFDRLLLGIINRVLVATSLLLYRYLEAAGLENVTVDDIRGCLRRLADKGYLNRLRFQTPTGQSNLQVYTLGELGRSAVESAGRTALRAGYVDRMDSLHAKRQLAALQFVIGQGYVPESSYMAFGRLIREIDDPTGNHLFRPQAVVMTDKTVFVEAVRQNGGSTDDLLQKMKRIHGTLAGGRPLNLTGPGNYEMVVVAESRSHMNQLMQELASRPHGRFCFKLYFTNDQDTFRKNGRLYELPERQGFGYKLTGKLAELFGL